jgi:hypothetical protein
MRSPAVTLFALGCLLCCQTLCSTGKPEQLAASVHTRDARLSAVSGHDPCCDPKPVPADPCEESSCCFFCCCSGAVLAHPLPLEHLTVTAILPLPWFVPDGEVGPTHTVVDPIADLRPPEPSLGTIVLLI